MFVIAPFAAIDFLVRIMSDGIFFKLKFIDCMVIVAKYIFAFENSIFPWDRICFYSLEKKFIAWQK